MLEEALVVSGKQGGVYGGWYHRYSPPAATVGGCDVDRGPQGERECGGHGLLVSALEAGYTDGAGS